MLRVTRRPKIANPFARTKIHLLPYGFWRDRDGRIVVSTRQYRPLLERRPGENVCLADPAEWVTFDHQAWFYDSATPFSERRAPALLAIIKLIDGSLPIRGVAHRWGRSVIAAGSARRRPLARTGTATAAIGHPTAS